MSDSDDSSDYAPEKKTKKVVESSTSEEEPEAPPPKSKKADKKGTAEKTKKPEAKKRKVESDEEEQDDEEEEEEKPTPKKGKKSKDNQCEIPGAFEIGNNKFVTCSEFKGKQRVDIREYYRKDGKLAPGKKGMNLSIDEFRKFIDQAAEMKKKFL